MIKFNELDKNKLNFRVLSITNNDYKRRFTVYEYMTKTSIYVDKKTLVKMLSDDELNMVGGGRLYINEQDCDINQFGEKPVYTGSGEESGQYVAIAYNDSGNHLLGLSTSSGLWPFDVKSDDLSEYLIDENTIDMTKEDNFYNPHKLICPEGVSIDNHGICTVRDMDTDVLCIPKDVVCVSLKGKNFINELVLPDSCHLFSASSTETGTKHSIGRVYGNKLKYVALEKMSIGEMITDSTIKYASMKSDVRIGKIKGTLRIENYIDPGAFLDTSVLDLRESLVEDDIYINSISVRHLILPENVVEAHISFDRPGCKVEFNGKVRVLELFGDYLEEGSLVFRSGMTFEIWNNLRVMKRKPKIIRL